MNDSPRKRNARPDTSRRNAALQKKMRQQKIRRQKALLIGGGLLLLFLLSMGTSACITRNRKAKEAAAQAEQKKSQEKEAKKETKKTFDPVSLTVSVVGDCTLGTDETFDYSTSLNAYFDNYGSSYFLQNVKPIFSADDLTIANFEGTLTESTDRQEKTFAFKGDPKYTEILTAGSVEAANLANNHSKDYGEQSYTDTIQYLENAGLTTFGYDRVAVKEIKGIKVGLVGIYVLADGMGRQQQVIDNIQAVKDQGAQVVIVSFHWGTEKSNYPDETQKALAHTAVDSGADLVLGHHPHVLQGIEKYKGKNIVYSLGNFCFGGNRNPADKDTMIFQQTFTFENGALVQDDVTNIIPCSLSSVQQYNDYQPTPLEGEEAQRVQQKIQEFSSGLSAEQ